MFLSPKVSHYKQCIPKVKYKASEEIYNFHKITEYSVLFHFLFVFVLTAISGMVFLETASVFDL